MLITSVTEFKNNLDRYLKLAETEDILISKNQNSKIAVASKKSKRKKREMTQEEYLKFLDDLCGSIDDPTFVEPPEIPWEYDTERIEIE